MIVEFNIWLTEAGGQRDETVNEYHRDPQCSVVGFHRCSSKSGTDATDLKKVRRILDGDLQQIVGADPVYLEGCVWYFWNETWTECHGPFPSEEAARAGLRHYIDTELGR